MRRHVIFGLFVIHYQEAEFSGVAVKQQQHFSLRCPTLFFAALRCPTLRFAALRCPTLPYAALRCPTLS